MNVELGKESTDYLLVLPNLSDRYLNFRYYFFFHFLFKQSCQQSFYDLIRTLRDGHYSYP